MAAHDEFIEFELKQEVVYIDGKKVADGYDHHNGGIVVSFIKLN